MSAAYCYDCLEMYPNCECEDSTQHIYGELRVAYLRGYRDALAGKDENI